MIVYGLDQVPEFTNGEIHLAIGMFDGVHRGHQELINKAVKAAKDSGGTSVVFTFSPHPSQIIHPDTPVPTIMSAKVKVHHLEDMGVNLVVQEEFTKNFSKTKAEIFLEKLHKAFPGLKAIYEGANFHFGHKHAGDISLLQQEGEKLGFEVIRGKNVEYKDEMISSSRIRQALLGGKISEANAMLGYKYYSVGMVTEGESRGEEMGFPTLNIVWRPELQPKYGVYAVKVKGKGGTTADGVANYGVRPTVTEDVDPTLEVHLFDEKTEWGLGDMLTVEWHHFIREEKKFENTDALKEQIGKDKDAARELLIG